MNDNTDFMNQKDLNKKTQIITTISLLIFLSFGVYILKLFTLDNYFHSFSNLS